MENNGDVKRSPAVIPRTFILTIMTARRQVRWIFMPLGDEIREVVSVEFLTDK